MSLRQRFMSWVIAFVGRSQSNGIAGEGGADSVESKPVTGWVDDRGIARAITDVFISYSSRDENRVREVARKLQAEGLTVFWDRDFSPGQDFGTLLRSALDNSRIVLVVWSRESSESDWVFSEAEYARSRKRLVSCRIERCTHGPPEIVVELLQPGSEHYGREVKHNLYAAAGVPELWLLDVAQQKAELLRWSAEGYRQQHPDNAGRYEVSSVPGLTFYPELLWADEDWDRRSSERSLFEVGNEAQILERRTPYIGKGIDETRGLVKLQAQLEPDTIAFDDYIYWCPEAKFELVDGRPWLGGHEGIQGLIGLLLKTFGLLEVVKLAHPKEWVEALCQAQSEDINQDRRVLWWKAARQQAQFLRDQFGISRVAVVGALLQDAPLDDWSKLALAVWGAPDVQKPYTSIRQVVEQIEG